MSVDLRLNYNMFFKNTLSWPRNIWTNIYKRIRISKSYKLSLLEKQRITFVSYIYIITEIVSQKFLLNIWVLRAKLVKISIKSNVIIIKLFEIIEISQSLILKIYLTWGHSNRDSFYEFFIMLLHIITKNLIYMHVSPVIKFCATQWMFEYL